MLAKRLVALFLMLIMVVAPIAVVSAVESDIEPIGAKGTFVPRLTAPKSSNKYYYSDLNKYERFGYGMPNCTAYAWGRAYEIMGYEPNLSLNDADTWWSYNKENKFCNPFPIYAPDPHGKLAATGVGIIPQVAVT